MITYLDCDLIELVKRRKMTSSEIAIALDAPLSNIHNKLAKLCARGLLKDSFRKDVNRAGLHAGEDRRVYGTTPLGIDALRIYKAVDKSLTKTGASRKPGRRSATLPNDE